MPPISHSRIPRPKAVSPSSSIKSKNKEGSNLPSISKNDATKEQPRKGRRRFGHRIRSYSTGSSESDESSASTYVQSEKRTQVRYGLKPDRSIVSTKYRRESMFKG